MNEIKITAKAKTPCFIIRNDTCGNPFRLTPYVANGEIWLASEGNGNCNDFMLNDITYWTPDEINEIFNDIDLDALRVGADEIEADGDKDSADWIRDWADTCQKAREQTKGE